MYQTACQDVVTSAMYSGSVVEEATDCRLLGSQDIG